MTCDKCANGKWIGTAFICGIKNRMMSDPGKTECEDYKAKKEQMTLDGDEE